MEIVRVAEFREDVGAFAPFDAYLVVKSQDQIERRRRLIESLRLGRIGRIEERPVAEGLVVSASVRPGARIDRSTARSVRKFREPRGLVPLAGGATLVAEIDRVVALDAHARELRSYRLPGFGFLHAIERSADGKRLLVVATGYDLLVEIDLATGARVWDWLAWEHGFTPNLDGIHLTRDPAKYAEYLDRGLPTRLVDFARADAHGLMTSARSNHPNSACYVPGKEGAVLVTLGHSGELIEVDVRSGAWRRVLAGMRSMPHGILPHAGGWMVTDTLAGACWFLDRDYAPTGKLVFAGILGKPVELGEAEWVQSVHPLGHGVYAALDANRGLILADVRRRAYAVVPIDENWCVHTLVPIDAPGADGR